MIENRRKRMLNKVIRDRDAPFMLVYGFLPDQDNGGHTTEECIKNLDMCAHFLRLASCAPESVSVHVDYHNKLIDTVQHTLIFTLGEPANWKEIYALKEDLGTTEVEGLHLYVDDIETHLNSLKAV